MKKPSNPIRDGYELTNEAKEKLKAMKDDWGNFRLPEAPLSAIEKAKTAMIKELEMQLPNTLFGEPFKMSLTKEESEKLLIQNSTGSYTPLADTRVSRGVGSNSLFFGKMQPVPPPEPEKQIVTHKEFLQDLKEFYLVEHIYEMDFDFEEKEAQYLLKLKYVDTLSEAIIEKERGKIINYLENTKINGINRIKVSFQSLEVFE